MSCLLTANAAGDSPVLNPLLVPPNIAIGDNTEILCTIKRGSQPVDFQWLHNGRQVQSHHKYKISSSQTSSHLYIGQIEPEDIGNFTCIIRNAYGEDSKTESVYMEGEKIKYLSKYSKLKKNIFTDQVFVSY